MAEVLVTPDIETAIQAYYRTELAARSWTVKVASKVPVTRPQYMVKVTLTGGSASGIVAHDAQVTVECWAANTDGIGNSVKASELARLCAGLTDALPGSFIGGVWISRVRHVSGPLEFPDPDTALPRYQFTKRLGIRKQAA
jgi:hypothetical protein